MNAFPFFLLIDTIALFFCFLYEKAKHNNKKRYKHYIIISAIVLIVILGLRNITVGVDTAGYAEAFGRVVDGRMRPIDYEWLGMGYTLISRIIGFVFGNNYVALNCVVGAFTIFFVYKAIIQNSKNKTLSLYLLLSSTLFYQMLNQSRQMLAIAIVLYSLKYLLDNKKLKYFITILLAASIHVSALFVLPFYFIRNLKINKHNTTLYILFSIIAFVGFTTIEKIIISTHYGSIYYGSEYYAASFTSIIMLLFRIFLTALLLFLNWRYAKGNKSTIKQDSNTTLINLAMAGTALQSLTIKAHIIGRVTTYFFIYYIISLPNMIENIGDKKKRNLYKIILILVFGVYHVVYYYLNAKSAGYDQYTFIFNGV